jgi:TPR repeat protein
MYWNGKGVAVNFSKAAFWCKQAAAKNDGYALLTLAALTADGSIPGGKVEAVRYATRAIERLKAEGQPAMARKAQGYLDEYMRDRPRDCTPYVKHTFAGDIGQVQFPCMPF